MKYKHLKKIDEFSKRHTFLTSFLGLIILTPILNFLIVYLDIAEYPPSPGLRGVKMVFFIIGDSFLWSIWWVIPILCIALFLFLFSKKKLYSAEQLTFRQNFILSFIPTLVIIVLFSIRIIQTYPSSYYSNPSWLYPLAIITSIIYSAGISAFLGWINKLSKRELIFQAIVVNVLIGLFYKFLYSVSNWHVM